MLLLNKAQVEELEQACRTFKGMLRNSLSWSLLIALAHADLFSDTPELGLSLDCVSQECFPLPTLGNELKARAMELSSGVGFFRIRGLESHQYTSEENVVMYLGISSYIGQKRGRHDEFGNMLRMSPLIDCPKG